MASVRYPVPLLYMEPGNRLFLLAVFVEGGAVWQPIGLNNQFFVNKTTQAAFTCLYAVFRVLSMEVRNKLNR